MILDLPNEIFTMILDNLNYIDLKNLLKISYHLDEYKIAILRNIFMNTLKKYTNNNLPLPENLRANINNYSNIFIGNGYNSTILDLAFRLNHMTSNNILYIRFNNVNIKINCNFPVGYYDRMKKSYPYRYNNLDDETKLIHSHYINLTNYINDIFINSDIVIQPETIFKNLKFNKLQNNMFFYKSDKVYGIRGFKFNIKNKNLFDFIKSLNDDGENIFNISVQCLLDIYDIDLD